MYIMLLRSSELGSSDAVCMGVEAVCHVLLEVDLGCNECTWMGSDQVDPIVGFVECKHIFHIACG